MENVYCSFDGDMIRVGTVDEVVEESCDWRGIDMSGIGMSALLRDIVSAIIESDDGEISATFTIK